VLTGSGNSSTLVYVLLTGGARVPRRTGAGSLPCHWVGVTPGSRVAGVPQTLVFQVAQEPSLTKGTLALIATDFVMAGSSIKAWTSSTIIFVLFTVLPNKPVDTDALVPPLRVLTGAVVLAGVVQGALVHIFQAVATLPVSRALASVGVDTIHTPSSILANIASTVINILLTVPARESIRTGAVVLVFPGRRAKAPIFTR